MATFFRNKVIKEVGLVPVKILDTDANTRSTIVGMSLANISPATVHASLMIDDDTSVRGYYIKDVVIPPNSSLRALSAGEKLVLAPDNALYAQADADAAYDLIVSYVDIV